MGTFCWHCGGDASEPDHPSKCDGRQGKLEAVAAAAEVPMLMSGLNDATYETSEAAAVSVDSAKDTQRTDVKIAIQTAGPDGRTDDAIQDLLHLDGSSERPRRWELWRMNLIHILRDVDGKPIKRLTRTNRRAVVWVSGPEPDQFRMPGSKEDR